MSDKKVLSLKRAVEAAAEAFSTRSFADVSISDISAESHCSTSTIYAVFGSKEKLFLEAILHIHGGRASFALSSSTSPSLFNLLRFAEARITSLATPQRRGVMRAISSQPQLAKPILDRIAKPQCGYDPAALEAEITACVRAGYLRAVDPSSIAYHIIAVTAYEPVVLGLLYGDDASLNVPDLVRKVFAPLVTVEGERLLDAFLAAEAERLADADDGYDATIDQRAAAARSG